MRYRENRPQPQYKAECLQQRLFGSALQLLFLLSLVAVLLTGAPMAGAQEVRAQEPGAAPTSTEERAGSLDQNRVARAREYLRDNPISPPDTSSPRATRRPAR